MRAIPAALTAAILFAAFGQVEAEARSTEARQPRHAAQTTRHAQQPARATRQQAARSASRQHRAARRVASRGGAGASGGGGGISCVPYARQVSGIAIRGNGREWWHNAAGLYARSHRPEPGAVMAMPSSGSMRLGHVAVVERIVSPREIEIQHANWGGPGIRRGSVMRGVSVVDVSANNDWSAVRVQVGHSDATYGRVYPVYGFILNRPDPTSGGMLAGAGRRPVTLAEGGDTPSLRALRGQREMAEAPAASRSRSRSASRSRGAIGEWRSLVLPANVSYR